MALHLYIDLLSQPSRAIYIFCRVNNIEAEIHHLDLMKREHQTPEYKAVNPMGQVPAIVDNGFKLFESHAILRYLATTKPGVSSNWYPSDPLRRARIDSVLDWHHGNLRRGAAGLFFNEVLAPYLGIPKDESKLAEFDKTLQASVDTIENVWLEEGGKFLCGESEITIADLILACEIIQLEVLKDKYASLVGPRDKLKKWMLDVEEAASPYFRDALSNLAAATAK
ncbi:hypothetical protein SELMODRAFT_270213 [Selaginella moellendorffii]|uniref:Uncharacterized protein n=1 Tax=Selaginella moellendorffii TaxID=88036 RepID=D8QN88_SELML|nr:glutathione S-transferase T1 [Selaginella moellendorffii]EFJ38715.1 hypothetical protein SELMODRAFT_270213 [Selaginella moellendorffii]|eukprot:XP_002961176.1 glutathione S-transferase T1 [Selaginella moellendorffii]